MTLPVFFAFSFSEDTFLGKENKKSPVIQQQYVVISLWAALGEV